VIWQDGNFVYANFDNLNRVNKVCENGSAGCALGLLITYTLDPLSRRDAIARPNGASSEFGYDLASRLTSLATFSSVQGGFRLSIAVARQFRLHSKRRALCAMPKSPMMAR
jgi:hypothetical protein